MKAMILAAGTGTRLKPLTDDIPKALIRVGEYTLLEIVIRRLAGAGIRSLVVNVHHYPEQIVEFLNRNENFGLEITISDESDELLDTGGALKKAAPLFAGEESILVHNIDILSNLDITRLLAFHANSGGLATLAVKQRPTSRNLLVDSSGVLCGWEYPDKKISILTRDNRKGLKTTAFSGIYVLSSTLFEQFPEDRVFGFIPWILDLAHTGKVFTWDQSPAFWYEAGRTDSLALAAGALNFDPGDPLFIRENS